MTLDPKTLVAHRGWPSSYPENTLAGFCAAIDAGAGNLEFDVQLTRDQVPMVIHDHTTKRTGVSAEDLFNLSADSASEISVGEPKRFADRFADSTIPTLAEVIAMLDTFGGQVFVEIKRASILRFGNDRCIDAILPLTDQLGTRGVIISFDPEAVSMAQSKGARQTGWVISAYDKQTLSAAADLQLDYLFVKRSRIARKKLPPNENWRWVVYDVKTPKQAQELFDHGADLVETDFIGEFLANGDRDSD
ncbi:MAG: glycerophosphodiester phosphodiesterase family protein [Gammaproteobacteria bacterium]